MLFSPSMLGSQCHQMGAVTARLVPDQHHPWVNQIPPLRAPPATQTHSQPHKPIVPSSCPPWHFRARPLQRLLVAQGPWGHGTALPGSVPAQGVGDPALFPRGKQLDHSSVTARSVKTFKILCCLQFIFLLLFLLLLF